MLGYLTGKQRLESVDVVMGALLLTGVYAFSRLLKDGLRNPPAFPAFTGNGTNGVPTPEPAPGPVATPQQMTMLEILNQPDCVMTLYDTTLFANDGTALATLGEVISTPGMGLFLNEEAVARLYSQGPAMFCNPYRLLILSGANVEMGIAVKNTLNYHFGNGQEAVAALLPDGSIGAIGQ